MSSSLSNAEAGSEELPVDLSEAGVYRTFADGSDHGLVVLAMGHPYWLVPDGDRFRLLVEQAVRERVREQLARFDRESTGWPPPPIADYLATRKGDLLTPLLWSLTVLAVFCAQRSHPRWTDLGILDAQAVFARGEWWRPGTALFLHADVDHVVANGLMGLLVFAALLSTVSLVRGWLLLGMASFAGNLAVAALHYPAAYRSLGSSTAIFAGVGLLTGRALRIVARSSDPPRWRSFFVPLAAGFAVLGLYGAGGLNAPVDVGAHATGFVAGVVAGLVAGISHRKHQE